MISTGNESNMYMPVAPAYGYGNCNNGGFGNDGWGGWLILFLLFGLFNGNGNGFTGNNNQQFPWLLNANERTISAVNGGFDNAAVMDQLGNIQGSITNGFSTMEVANCNRAMNQMQTDYQNQIASMNQRFADTTAITAQMSNLSAGLQNCCCENRSNIADLKYTVATENCADRTNSNQNTQAILTAITGGIQSIKDQMCQDKIDAKNDTIDQLRSELLYARGQASQVSQTAAIEQYVRPTPSPAYIVANPYCNYNQTYGCGCGAA